MNNTNEFLQDYMTVQARARELELNPPKDDTNLRTMKALVLLVLMYCILSLSILEFFPPANDGTDTGVGCIEDCLETGEPIKE